MTQNEIIKYIYDNKIVETIVKTIGRGENKDDLEDLVQDMYVMLLTKPRSLLQSLYDKKELNFYLASCIYRQIRSADSPYYKKYKRLRMNSLPVNEQYMRNYSE